MHFSSSGSENLNTSALRLNMLARGHEPPSQAHILTPNHQRYIFDWFVAQAMLPMNTTGSNALGLTSSSWMNKMIDIQFRCKTANFKQDFVDGWKAKYQALTGGAIWPLPSVALADPPFVLTLEKIEENRILNSIRKYRYLVWNIRVPQSSMRPRCSLSK